MRFGQVSFSLWPGMSAATSSHATTAGQEKTEAVSPRTSAASHAASGCAKSALPASGRSNFQAGSRLQKLAAMWFIFAGAARGADRDFLTLNPPGNPGPQGVPYFNLVKYALANVSASEVHSIDPGRFDAYPFPRNLAARGPNRTVVMSDPAVLQPHKRLSGNAILNFLQAKQIPYTLMDEPVNLANVHYDDRLDLLVMMHTPWRDSDSWSLSPRHKNQVQQVITAFGRPKNIIEFWSNNSMRYESGHSLCYDMDVFFHMTSTLEGEKIALLYKPCISKFSAIDKMDRDNVVEQFKKLGIHIIYLGDQDFRRLAANAISPEPGKILFSFDVSADLKNALKAKGMEAVVAPVPVGVPEEFFGLVPFGIHCVTADIPGDQAVEEDVPEEQQEQAPGNTSNESVRDEVPPPSDMTHAITQSAAGPAEEATRMPQPSPEARMSATGYPRQATLRTGGISSLSIAESDDGAHAVAFATSLPAAPGVKPTESKTATEAAAITQGITQYGGVELRRKTVQTSARPGGKPGLAAGTAVPRQ